MSFQQKHGLCQKNISISLESIRLIIVNLEGQEKRQFDFPEHTLQLQAPVPLETRNGTN